jgi:hypothetical protein
MLQRTILLVIAVLVVTTISCGITVNLPEESIDIGPLVTDEIEIDYPDSDETTELMINFGAGELKIYPGAENLVSGSATYNVADFKPVVKTFDENVEISQGDLDYEFVGVPNWDDVENEWNLNLGSEPIDLEIRAGAYSGRFELGGLAIEELRIASGAADVEINFSEPNILEMDTFHFETGASNVEMSDLGNANFARMDFVGGLGNYVLDFSGELQQDADIRINVGASSLTIIVPEDMAASLNLDSTLSDVDKNGDWTGSGQRFSHPGEGYTLDFDIDMGLGSVTLKTR